MTTFLIQMHIVGLFFEVITCAEKLKQRSLETFWWVIQWREEDGYDLLFTTQRSVSSLKAACRGEYRPHEFLFLDPCILYARNMLRLYWLHALKPRSDIGLQSQRFFTKFIPRLIHPVLIKHSVVKKTSLSYHCYTDANSCCSLMILRPEITKQGVPDLLSECKQFVLSCPMFIRLFVVFLFWVSPSPVPSLQLFWASVLID